MDELGPIADELTQFAQWWRGDPGLGQASHAEQVDEVGGVALIFSDLRETRALRLVCQVQQALGSPTLAMVVVRATSANVGMPRLTELVRRSAMRSIWASFSPAVEAHA